MTTRSDLGALLADPTRAAEVPATEVPALLATVASEQARLAAVQGALAARLVRQMPDETDTGVDRLLSAEEVHNRTTLSLAWLYRHADDLPFAKRVGRRVLFSEARLAKWLAHRTP